MTDTVTGSVTLGGGVCSGGWAEDGGNCLTSCRQKGEIYFRAETEIIEIRAKFQIKTFLSKILGFDELNIKFRR